jgi:hypothetical protein
MNKQVENYFIDLKLKKIYETIITEAKGGGVKLPVTESDIEFAHQVRTKYRQQGLDQSGFPQGWKVIAIKWAFLHPSPLHRFVKKFDNETQQWGIYETLRVGIKDRHIK